MQNSLILNFYNPFLTCWQLLSIVIQHLLILWHSESRLDEISDLAEIGIGWGVYQKGLFLIVPDVEIYQLRSFLLLVILLLFLHRLDYHYK